MPTARRSTACLLVRAGGDRLLFDCGEGSQRQMQRSTGLVQVDDIYVTHLHADHYLGIPGLLKTYDLGGRERGLRVIGPPGLIDLFKSLRRIFGRLAYEVELIELGAGEAVSYDGYEVRSFAVEHRMTAYGYALVEDERPGRFDPEAAQRLGVAPGPDFKRLQDGNAVEGSSGPVRPGDVMGSPRRGRKLVVAGDTAPCEMTALAAHDAQLLVHDASFADEEAERAGRPVTRPPARPPSSPPTPASTCWRWCTSPRATTSARCSPRPSRRSIGRSPRATSISSRFRSPSAAARA